MSSGAETVLSPQLAHHLPPWSTAIAMPQPEAKVHVEPEVAILGLTLIALIGIGILVAWLRHRKRK